MATRAPAGKYALPARIRRAQQGALSHCKLAARCNKAGRGRSMTISAADLDRLLPTEKDETKRVRWQALSDLMKRRRADMGHNSGEYESDIPNILATYY